jgi:uncharacterized membrane protein YgdD (TMEM256/DUF423 family)
MWLNVGAISAALCVVMHALAAHLIKRQIEPALVAGFEAALRQHMFHAVGLLVVGLLARQHPSRRLDAAGWAFVAGTLLFSFALYARALTGAQWLAALNPFGGLAFIGGWLLLIWAARIRTE